MARDLFELMGISFDRARGGGDIEPVKNIEFDLVLHYETPDAWRLSMNGDDNLAEWFPKRLVNLHRGSKQSAAIKSDGQHTVLPVVTVEIPEWLAKDKGLI